MRRFFQILPASTLVLTLACAGSTSAGPALQPASPACTASAREILTMKNAAAMYGNVIPGIVQETKQKLIQVNPNYRDDLDEVASVVAQTLAGREKEIGDKMAQIYCNEFSEQDLEEIVTFYKSSVGQKLLKNEPRAIQSSMSYMNERTTQFASSATRAISRRDAQAGQADLIMTRIHGLREAV